jgi:predicted PurR-regulated permease PerM
LTDSQQHTFQAGAGYLAGQLICRLRDIVLLMLVAGFTAMLLNPAVAKVQRRVPRRGLAVLIVTLRAALVFIGYAQSLSKPALTVGKGAVSIIIELLTLFVLVLLLLLEGPKMWNWTLGQMSASRRATGS